jgi:hypothetical protein
MGTQHKSAQDFEISPASDLPATLWPRLPASDKRLGSDTLGLICAFGDFIKQNNVLFNAGATRRFDASPSTNRISSQNEGVVPIVKNR